MVDLSIAILVYQRVYAVIPAVYQCHCIQLCSAHAAAILPRMSNHASQLPCSAILDRPSGASDLLSLSLLTDKCGYGLSENRAGPPKKMIVSCPEKW